jgi:hypothetical protein
VRCLFNLFQRWCWGFQMLSLQWAGDALPSIPQSRFESDELTSLNWWKYYYRNVIKKNCFSVGRSFLPLLFDMKYSEIAQKVVLNSFRVHIH